MWCSRLQLSLALLSIALAVLSVSSAPPDNRYRGEILQRAMAATGSRGKAEITEYSLLSELENAKKEAQSDTGERNLKRAKPRKRKKPKKNVPRRTRGIGSEDQAV
ncbi:somatostatin-1A-like [Scyliorhinus canicula]|uniref:somatostatin-1A-like n=1 Tax=Scyliorhinus canicula TaxID=7830 RepID=UPI0018F76481|nr:somatostatin-1A-like [Scyliorhinus canicula]